MIPYWLMFLVAFLGTLSKRRLVSSQASLVWWMVGIGMALMVGLRFHVGGDWFNYEQLFLLVGERPFSFVFEIGDPGYYGMSWLLYQWGGTPVQANFVCGVLFAFGVVTFCRNQPNPWLALIAAVPYLVIVVGMGYTRQSVAVALGMVGLVALGKGMPRKFVMWVLIGALFHKTALLLLPIAALAAARNRVWTAVWVSVVATVGAWLFVTDSAAALWVNYVDSDYAFASEGGAIRVAMNAVPAMLMFLYGRRLAADAVEYRLWWWIAALSLACVPLLFLSATAVDRLALYLIPLQLYVFARMPRLARSMRQRTLFTMGIVSYYAAVQFVWLNFATHAPWWVPYRFAPFA